MRKRIIFISIIIVILMMSITALLLYKNSLNNDNNLSTEEIIEEKTEEILTEKNSNIIGHLKIDSIGLNAPIKDGTELSTLKTAIGHFKETAYFNGNVCFAAHNRGYNQNFFEKLYQVKKGDKVEYITKYTTQEYYVTEIKEVEETDLTVLNPTEQDQVTMITCIKNQKEKRLCVIATKQ